ncbi:MAG: HDOD domain-containing protein, partial [Nocardiopsis sp. BM-2018]
QLISTRYDVPANDAFALGLLHDLGSGLLYMTDPTAWAEVERHGGVGGELEVELFGITHQAIGARVLEAWRFPREFCDAVARHHRCLSRSEAPFTRCLIAGRLVATLALDLPVPGQPTSDPLADHPGERRVGTDADEHGSTATTEAEAAHPRSVLLEHDFDDAQLDRIVDRVALEYGALGAVLAETVGAA